MCRHACYNACMKAKQYTIRNIPEPVDRYLRKRAKISGQSLNQVVIDELAERAGTSKTNLLDSLDWFIGGAQIDQETLRVLEEDDKAQKELVKKEWFSDDN